MTSRLHGATAGKDLEKYDALIDLVDDDDLEAMRSPARVTRTVGAPIKAGDRLEVGADGRIYPAGESA